MRQGKEIPQHLHLFALHFVNGNVNRKKNHLYLKFYAKALNVIQVICIALSNNSFCNPT